MTSFQDKKMRKTKDGNYMPETGDARNGEGSAYPSQKAIAVWRWMSTVSAGLAA